MKEEKQIFSSRIVLISDSHEDLNSFRSAIRILKERGAETLVHLGDLGDSLHLHLLDEAIRLIRQEHILAVKGNNDFILENLLLGQPQGPVPGSDQMLDFLRDLPMKITWNGICFAHSLPFESLRAFYEPIDIGSSQRAEEVFHLTDHRVLFCGHSHRPVLLHWPDGKTSRKPIPGDAPLFLNPEDRYIIVTGSVLEGECALFDASTWSLERIRIN